MSRYAYVNGRYVIKNHASVHIEDRGYQFADGVYEVCLVSNGKIIDGKGHLDRLGYSLSELQIDWPMSRAALEQVMAHLIRKNRLDYGIIYLQVTRGVAPRNHAFPTDGTRPSLVMTTKAMKPYDRDEYAKGIKVILIDDIRWDRHDIKSIALLPNCLGKQRAVEAGAYEAWQLDPDGMITEGVASNAWIVTHDDKLVTRPPSKAILNGITRLAVLGIADEEGLTFEERAFNPDEALAAREAFVTGTTSFVKPVTHIDNKPVKDGKAGPLTLKLLDYYMNYIRMADAD